MYIVTGGAGFVGSNLIKRLNELGIKNILIVDSFSEKDKFKNLEYCKFSDIINFRTNDFYSKIQEIVYVDAVFHIGANADVLVNDCDLMLEDNFKHSKFWYEFCEQRGVPLVYASSSAVYGNSKKFTVTHEFEKPHNEYAFSKLAFDRYVHERSDSRSFQCVGYRFFNVFGPNECYKNKNASLLNRFFKFALNDKKIEIFDQEIFRDYVYVGDVCNILIDSISDPKLNGVFNLGSGNVWSNKDIAIKVLNIMNDFGFEYDIQSSIQKISMPESLLKKFQFYTKASDLPTFVSKYTKNTDEHMNNYVKYLINGLVNED